MGPLPPEVRPASRTRSAPASADSAWDTVGLDNPESRAICARDTGPIARMNSSTERSLIARSRLGVPAAKVWSPPVPPPLPKC